MLIEFKGVNGGLIFIEHTAVEGIVSKAEDRSEILMNYGGTFDRYDVGESPSVCAKRVNDALVAWEVAP